jgi:hypothetical protein
MPSRKVGTEGDGDVFDQDGTGGGEASNGAWDFDALRTEDSEHSTTQDAGDFDLDALRLSQDFGAELGGKKLLTVVPVRRPHKQEFFRVHPAEEWRFPTAVLTDEETRETFLVAPSLREVLASDIKPVTLFTCLSRQNVLFLWPAKMPTGDRRAGAWHASAFEAAQIAMRQWIRLRSNQALGAYEIFKAAGYAAEPEWPDITFNELVKLAFKGRYIASADHPVLRQLRGEI